MIEEKLQRDDVVIWKEDGRNIAWVNGGQKEWFLFENEKDWPLEDLFQHIKAKWQGGKYYRCSDCGVEMPKEEVAGWPLFAGAACKEHWGKHVEKLETERENGHVCRFCGEPYGNCAC